jgi:acetyl esterase/lipase
MIKISTFASLWIVSLFFASASETMIYKTIDDTPLKLLIDKPADWKVGDKRPAILFFFGGGWVGGSLAQFQRHSAYFASRGMLGIRVEYRTIPKGDRGPPLVCVADAKSAMRFVYTHAAKLGIDPEKIGAGGGSAGGHLAAFAAMVEGLDDPQDDLNVPCTPKALVLFNPVFDNGPGEWGNERVGLRYREFSPAHHIRKGAPPMIVFLGDEDNLIPVRVLENFESRMKSVGSRCDVHIYPGAGHGFFNSDRYFVETVIEADKFLASLDWINGEPTLDASN